MTSPVSVGDLLQLARLAYRLGQAFTSGRKSAPAEFVEIQNLLYSLSQALDYASRNPLRDGPDHVAPVESDIESSILEPMITRCRDTLTHLDTLIANYSNIQSDASQGLSNWKENVRKNWKKILWTKEGGDISRLKITLSAHIDALNLAVSSMNKSQVDTVHSKLDEIYRWFKDNLDGKRLVTPQQDSGDQPQQFIDHMFSIFEISPGSDRKRSICPRASVNLWQSDLDVSDSSDIFRCCCSSSPPRSRDDSTNNRPRLHQHQLGYKLHPASLILQIPSKSSKQRWQMHVSTPLRADPATILLENLHPSAIPLFERFKDQITYFQAKKHVLVKQSTMMVSHSSDEPHLGTVAILSMMTPSSTQEANDIAFASFTSNGRQFVTPRVREAHLLHYCLISKHDLCAKDSTSDRLSNLAPEPYARYVLECDNSAFATEEQDDRIQYTIQINRKTPLEPGDNPRTVKIAGCLCTSNVESHDDTTTQWVQCSSIVVEFFSATAARAYLEELRAMQSELFRIYLRYPYYEEQIVFRRSIDHCFVYDTGLMNATLTVVHDFSSDNYRLIVVNELQSQFVCVELPDNFLHRVSTGDDIMADSFAGWYVEMTVEGAAITRTHVELGPLLGDDHSWSDLNGPARSLEVDQDMEM